MVDYLIGASLKDLGRKWFGFVKLEQIERLIIPIRGKQVILDRDLARLYGVETRVLNQAVQRNIERFPEDFMFQLTKDEYENMSSQFVTTENEDIGAYFPKWNMCHQ